MTDEIPNDVKRWTAKRRQDPDDLDQSLDQALNKTFRWLANKGALHSPRRGADGSPHLPAELLN